MPKCLLTPTASLDVTGQNVHVLKALERAGVDVEADHECCFCRFLFPLLAAQASAFPRSLLGSDNSGMQTQAGQDLLDPLEESLI